MFHGREFVGDFAETLLNQAMVDVRLNLHDQGIEATRIVGQNEVDVPGVLFFEPVMPGHFLHDEDGGDRRDTHHGLIRAASRQFAANLRLDESIERKIAATGFAGALVFTREEIDLYFDWISADIDGLMKDERLPVILFVAAREKKVLNRRVPGILEVAMVAR